MAGGEWYGDELAEKFRQASVRGVTDAIKLVEDEAVRLIMSPPKSGIVYNRRGIKHQSSAPGEAPASDTGALVDSRTIDFDLTNPNRPGARLTFRTLYAFFLEFGTQIMEARPFARPALMNTRRAVLAAIVAPMRLIR